MDTKKYRVDRKHKVDLSAFDPDDTASVDKAEAAEVSEALKERLGLLQDKLFAESRQSLLIVLQGMDCSGKNGVIKHAMSQVNPGAFQVHSFKKPSDNETSRDYLWRVHRVVPEKGQIGVFNRSHYEDILVPYVHQTISKAEAENRIKHINHFERLLTDTGTRVVKLFLHLSKEKQAEKLNDRLSDPEKMWKFDESDLREREFWNEYLHTYEWILSRCSSADAPWYIIPANHRWFRNFLALQILVHELDSMKPAYPAPKVPDVHVEP